MRTLRILALLAIAALAALWLFGSHDPVADTPSVARRNDSNSTEAMPVAPNVAPVVATGPEAPPNRVAVEPRPDPSPGGKTGHLRVRVVRKGAVEDVAFEAALEVGREAPRMVAGRHGLAEIDSVPVGVPLRVVAVVKGSEYAPKGEVAGPPSEGATSEVTIGLDDAPTLRLRLLRPDRTPVANTKVRVSRDDSNGSTLTSIRFEVETDELGYVDFNGAAFPRGSTRSFQFEAPSTHKKMIGEIALSRALCEGENDLGDLVLTALPFIASGRVVDSSGSPVAGAQVELVVHGDGPGRFGATSDWDGTDLSAATAIDGAFELDGVVSGRLALVAKSESGQSARVEFESGAKGIELMLIEKGAIEGSLRMPAGFPTDLLRPELLDAEVPASSMIGATAETRISEDGSFVFRALAAKRYDFAIRGSHPDPIVVVKGVDVAPGRTTHDPRMQEMQLEAQIGILQVEVVDAANAPLDASVMVKARTRLESSGAAQRGRGVFVVVTQGQGQDLIVSASGYVPQQIVDAKASPLPLRVVLARAMSVEFTVAGEFSLDSGKSRLAVRLEPTAKTIESIPDTLESMTDEAVPFDSERKARIGVAFPGEYRVVLGLREPFGSMSILRTIGEAKAVRVDSSGEQHFTLEVPPEVRATLDA